MINGVTESHIANNVVGSSTARRSAGCIKTHIYKIYTSLNFTMNNNGCLLQGKRKDQNVWLAVLSKDMRLTTDPQSGQ